MKLLNLSFRRAASAGADLAGTDVDGLGVFGSEESQPAAEAESSGTAGARRRPALPRGARWLVVLAVMAVAGGAGRFGYERRALLFPSTGQLTIQTTPANLDVVLSGRHLGKTPLTTALPAGAYELQVGTAPNARTIKVDVLRGAAAFHRLEFADREPRAVASTASLRVQTEPAHLPVTVDGAAFGAAPVTIGDLAAGAHDISVRTPRGLLQRSVSLHAGETLSILISTPAAPVEAAGVAAGWMRVSSAVPLQLRERGKVIGTSESDRTLLTAGDHEIEFVNDALGFTARRTVRIDAGKTAAAAIELPSGLLSVNALPWAEVWIDGKRVGETPMGNIATVIGPHDVVFRHPEFGERHESVVIAVGKPARLGVDLRKK